MTVGGASNTDLDRDAQAVSIEPPRLAARMHGARPPLLLDVRAPEDFLGVRGHIEGACLFPFDQLEASLTELRGLEGRDFVLVCEDGSLARRAADLLTEHGFGALCVLEGGMVAWEAEGLPVRR